MDHYKEACRGDDMCYIMYRDFRHGWFQSWFHIAMFLRPDEGQHRLMHMPFRACVCVCSILRL